MSAVTLRGHYDGSKIVLDEPFELKPNARLMITVLPEEQSDLSDGEREAWFKWAKEKFSYAYDEDEPEYTMSLIKKANPDYDPNYERR